MNCANLYLPRKIMIKIKFLACTLQSKKVDRSKIIASETPALVYSLIIEYLELERTHRDQVPTLKFIVLKYIVKTASFKFLAHSPNTYKAIDLFKCRIDS